MSGYIGMRKVPTTDNASGVWRLDEQAKAKKDGIWPRAGFRYWRLYVASSWSTDFGFANSLVVGELELRESVGGADETGGKTATASQEYSAASGAIDNNTGTQWQSYNGGANIFPSWLKVDIGSSPIKVAQYLINVGQYNTSGPKSWELQYSSDNSNWVTVHTVTDAPSWSAYEARTYTV